MAPNTMVCESPTVFNALNFTIHGEGEVLMSFYFTQMDLTPRDRFVYAFRKSDVQKCLVTLNITEP